MKFIVLWFFWLALLISVIYLAPKPPAPKPPALPPRPEPVTQTWQPITITIFTNSGHRFAIAYHFHGIAICEVTDQSAVNSEGK